MSKRIWSVLLAAIASPIASSAQALLGPEFQVNSFTTSNQENPAIASDAAGNFVVVWQGAANQDGSSYGVFGRRYDAAGAALTTTEFRVNAFTTSFQWFPDVASDATGRLVTLWRADNHESDPIGLFGRQYDASGVPGAEFLVNSLVADNQTDGSATWFPNGGFVAVWGSFGWGDPAEMEVFARVHDDDGTPLGPEFRVNSYSTGRQYRPVVAADADGNFVVAWESAGQDGSGWGVFGQRYDSSGTPLGGEFRVNLQTTGNQRSPSVARHSGGEFVVLWGGGQDGSGSGVFGRRYHAGGAPLTGDFLVNTYTTYNQHNPDMAMDATGAFVVVWQSSGLDGSTYAVAARRYDGAGVPEGAEFRVNSYVTSLQQGPSVASARSGRFVVAWESYGQDGSSWGIFARQVTPDLIFRDGFESGGLSAWTASSTDGGDLTASGLVALDFTTAGLRGVVDDAVGLYVQDDTPEDEDRYRARFYFDTNGFDPGETQDRSRTRLFIAFEENPTRRLAAVVLRRLGGAYSLMGRARLDDNSQYDTGFFPISDGAHFVELDWQHASDPDANDGSFELWIDGTSVHAATTLDNSVSAVDFVRMGALSVKTGASGTLYWDEFESRRLTAIGP